MARPATSGQRTAIAAARRNNHLIVEVMDAGGTYRSLSALGGVDFVKHCEMTEDIDQRMISGSLVVRREHQGVSIAPFITAASVNNFTGVYSPWLYGGRSMRIRAAVVAPGADPSSSLVLMGLFKIDKVDWESSDSEISIDFRDIGARIFDTFVEDTAVYGAPDPGQPVQGVVQALINAFPPPGGATLVVVNDPSFNIIEYSQEKQSLGDAISALVIQAASDVRYRFDGSGNFTLQLWKPNRAAVSPDWTLGPTEYIDVTQLSTSDADVRNVVRVNYINRATGEPGTFTAINSASITQFQRKFFEITEDASSQIDTAAEATTMASAARDDLSAPKADQEIKCQSFWIAQLGDLGAFPANGVHYDVDQTFGVVGIKHEWENGDWFTFIRVRGAPSGAFRTWLNLKRGTGAQLLSMRIVRESANDLQIVVRVYVADALVSLSPINITAENNGNVSVVPINELLLPPTDAVTSNLLTTVFKEFTITRPEPDQPQGRVTFTAQRINEPLGTVVGSIDVEPRGTYGLPAPVYGPDIWVEGTAEGGAGEGALHLPILFEPNTAEVLIWATQSATDPPEAPDLVENRLSYRITRHEGTIASDPNWQTEVDIATNTGFYRRIFVQSIGPTGLLGEPFTIESVRCVDGLFAPLGPPTSFVVVFSVVAGKSRATLTWVVGDPLADVRVWRNGYILAHMAPTSHTLIDDDLTPAVAYNYKLDHEFAGSTSAFADNGTVDSAVPTLVAPTWAATYPRSGGYDSTIVIPPPNGLVLIRAVNPDPDAETLVFMNDQATLGGTYTQVGDIPAGQTDLVLNSGDMLHATKDDQRWFYLVASRSGYIDSAASAIQTATFGF